MRENYYYNPQLFKMPASFRAPSPPLTPPSAYGVGAIPGDTSKMLLLAGIALALWVVLK